MNEIEKEVYQLTQIYENEFRKIFGTTIDHQITKRNVLPKRNDFKKSNLFRHCWKMRRETRGLLEFSEYKNYIHANLLIIKINNGFIDPNCICGDKAWIRYKVWKRRYDQKMAELNATTPPPSTNTTNPKIIAEIDRTKKFIFEHCEGEPTFDKLNLFVQNNIFKFWVASGKVSPYYVTLSPFIAKTGKMEDLCTAISSSIATIKEKTTQEVINYFKHEFSHEYNSSIS